MLALCLALNGRAAGAGIMERSDLEDLHSDWLHVTSVSDTRLVDPNGGGRNIWVQSQEIAYKSR